ncbi:MAG: hypothetical protein HY000_23800 [Planctomycetes bacterium]|nr:hypothetical protein [Planctomycetota bacterium]
MSEEGDRLIAKAQAKLKGLETEVIKTKEFINQIRAFDELPPLYSDLALKPEVSIGAIRSDQFYGRPLATVVREILEMRKASGLTAASVAEIYSKLVEGGYQFETSNEENAKRVLRISLTKNPAFHKIPNGDYGLKEWYPNAKQPQPKKDKQTENGNGHDGEVVVELPGLDEPGDDS